MYTIREGNESDYQLVADFWNSLIGVKDSIWYFSPTVSAEHIATKVAQGFTLYVAYDEDTFIGYGMWKKEWMLGIAAINKEVYLKIGREWAKFNQGATGRVRFPNIVCNEISWLEDVLPVHREPESFKPLKPGEDISTRKCWTYIVTWSLDEYKLGVDALYGE